MYLIGMIFAAFNWDEFSKKNDLAQIDTILAIVDKRIESKTVANDKSLAEKEIESKTVEEEYNDFISTVKQKYERLTSTLMRIKTTLKPTSDKLMLMRIKTTLEALSMALKEEELTASWKELSSLANSMNFTDKYGLSNTEENIVKKKATDIQFKNALNKAEKSAGNNEVLKLYKQNTSFNMSDLIETGNSYLVKNHLKTMKPSEIEKLVDSLIIFRGLSSNPLFLKKVDGMLNVICYYTTVISDLLEKRKAKKETVKKTEEELTTEETAKEEKQKALGSIEKRQEDLTKTAKPEDLSDPVSSPNTYEKLEEQPILFRKGQSDLKEPTTPKIFQSIQKKIADQGIACQLSDNFTDKASIERDIDKIGIYRGAVKPSSTKKDKTSNKICASVYYDKLHGEAVGMNPNFKKQVTDKQEQLMLMQDIADHCNSHCIQNCKQTIKPTETKERIDQEIKKNQDAIKKNQDAINRNRNKENEALVKENEALVEENKALAKAKDNIGEPDNNSDFTISPKEFVTKTPKLSEEQESENWESEKLIHTKNLVVYYNDDTCNSKCAEIAPIIPESKLEMALKDVEEINTGDLVVKILSDAQKIADAATTAVPGAAAANTVSKEPAQIYDAQGKLKKGILKKKQIEQGADATSATTTIPGADAANTKKLSITVP